MHRSSPRRLRASSTPRRCVRCRAGSSSRVSKTANLPNRRSARASSSSSDDQPMKTHRHERAMGFFVGGRIANPKVTCGQPQCEINPFALKYRWVSDKRELRSWFDTSPRTEGEFQAWATAAPRGLAPAAFGVGFPGFEDDAPNDAAAAVQRRAALVPLARCARRCAGAGASSPAQSTSGRPR